MIPFLKNHWKTLLIISVFIITAVLMWSGSIDFSRLKGDVTGAPEDEDLFEYPDIVLPNFNERDPEEGIEDIVRDIRNSLRPDGTSSAPLLPNTPSPNSNNSDTNTSWAPIIFSDKPPNFDGTFPAD